MIKPPASPFRYFNSSREVIRLVVMMYVRYRYRSETWRICRSSAASTFVMKQFASGGTASDRCSPAKIRQQRISRVRGFRTEWHLAEMYVKLNEEMVHLWRAIDHEAKFSRVT